MFNDIKSGKLKAPKEIQDIVSGASNIDVIEPFRNIYGENALEQLDSLIPDFKKTATEIDAEKLARSKYEFTPKLDRPKESYTKEEMEKILKDEEPEKFAKGGMVERENYAFGSLFKKLFSSIGRETPSTPSIPSTLDVPLEVVDRYKNYLSQFEKPTTSSLGSGIGGIFRRLFNSIKGSSPQTISNDDLYNLYRSGVEGKANGGRINNVKSKGLDYLMGL
jgi:hypothetical protein